MEDAGDDVGDMGAAISGTASCNVAYLIRLLWPIIKHVSTLSFSPYDSEDLILYAAVLGSRAILYGGTYYTYISTAFPKVSSTCFSLSLAILPFPLAISTSAQDLLASSNTVILLS